MLRLRRSIVPDAKATASVLGLPVDLSGPVHYGGPQPDDTVKLIVFLDNDMLNQHQTVEGFVALRKSDGATGSDGLSASRSDTFSIRKPKKK